MTDPADRPVVLITGRSGRLGSAAARRLEGPCRVVGLDVRRPRQPDGAFVEMDVSDPASIRGALEKVRRGWGERIASVLHFAAFYDFDGAPDPRYETVTIRGTERLLEALQAFDVEQFVFSSTMLVHAPCVPGQRIDEDSPLAPRWPYPESKVAAENVVRTRHGGIPRVVLRIGAVYDDYGHSLPLAHQIQRIRERTLTARVFPGDAEHGQSFLHTSDLVEALVRLIDRRDELPDETTLLLGEPDVMAYSAIQDTLGHLLHGEDWATWEIPEGVARAGAWAQQRLPGEAFIHPFMVALADDHYALDVSRAERLLGWTPRHQLRTTLPRIVEALKRDPDAWYAEHGLT